MNIKEGAALQKRLLLQLIENQVLPQGGYLAGGTAVYDWGQLKDFFIRFCR